MVNKKLKIGKMSLKHRRRSYEGLSNELQANSSTTVNSKEDPPDNMGASDSTQHKRKFNEDSDSNIPVTSSLKKSSCVPINLATETLQNSTCTEATVIDVIDTKQTPDADCTVVTPKSSPTSDVTVTRYAAKRSKKQAREQQVLANSLESGECTVEVPENNCSTVLWNPSKRKRKKEARSNRVKEFLDRVTKMNAPDKGRLHMFCQTILSICPAAPSRLEEIPNIKVTKSRVVDRFIKHVIREEPAPRNSDGSNIYNPEREVETKSGPRMVVIDGSNVAISRWASTDPGLLDHLERIGLVVYTPSREVQGRNITCYDDRYIVQCAAEFDGVIVSRDRYRDLLDENPRWRTIIETRLLQFTWVDDMIMFPEDPMGKNGPTLQQFLRHTPGAGPVTYRRRSV